MHQSLQTIMKESVPHEHWKEHLKIAICSDPNEKCYTNKCKECPNIIDIQASIQNMVIDFDHEYDVKYQQWVSTDRPEIVSVTKPVSEFILEYSYQLISLKTHDFIAKKQAENLEELKSNLKTGECVVLMDFAQNYSHVVQNSIQSQFFSMRQTTLHPVVIYWKQNDELLHKSFVYVSDVMKHDTIFVYCVQQKLMEEIKKVLPTVNRIHYYTDGCASQYKSKKYFLNLLHHLNDFGIHATHHFHATSHGKGPIDGVGGTSKREVYQASMKGENILNASEFHQYLVKKNTAISSSLITESEYSTAKTMLTERWLNAKTIKGTQKLHYFCMKDADDSIIQCKTFSQSEDILEYKILTKENDT